MTGVKVHFLHEKTYGSRADLHFYRFAGCYTAAAAYVRLQSANANTNHDLDGCKHYLAVFWLQCAYGLVDFACKVVRLAETCIL